MIERTFSIQTILSCSMTREDDGCSRTGTPPQQTIKTKRSAVLTGFWGKLVNPHGLVTRFQILPWVNYVLDVMRLDFATLGALTSPSGRSTSRWLVPELIITQLEHRRPMMAVRPPNLQRRTDKITSLGWRIH